MDKKEAVKEAFESNKKLEVVFATTDGNCFPTEQLADSHSHNIGGNEEKRKVEKFERKDVLNTKQDKPQKEAKASAKKDEAKTDEKAATDKAKK